MNDRDRTIIRELAKRLADHAAEPIQQERMQLWTDYNALRPVRPLVLVSPEGGWRDLVNDDHMQCQDEAARKIEWQLRSRLFKAERIKDDQPITDIWHIPVVVRRGSLGLEPTFIGGRWGGRDAWDWEAPIKEPADVDKLHIREVSVDFEATEAHRAEMEQLFGDILKVRMDRGPRIGAKFARGLFMLRDNDRVLLDMYDNPQLLHDILQVLLESHLHEMKVLEEADAYRLNNDPDIYCGTGGIGVTDQLPAEGFDGHVRPEDLWGVAENQEFAGVGPDQVHEFAVKYEAKAIGRCGLAYYGCCEAVHDYMDMLLENFPNLRAMSVSPWCDREKAAEILQDKVLYYWKPNPTLTCAPRIHWQETAETIRETLHIARGCRLAMVLKDTHTFCGEPERPCKWVRIARDCIEEVRGVEA